MERSETGFSSWLRQPTTITGIGALVGTIAGVAAHMLTGDTTVSAGAGAIAFGAVNLVINDNSVATDAQKLVSDLVARAPTAVVVADVAAGLSAAAADLGHAK